MRVGDIPQILRREDVKSYLETSWALAWPMVLIMLFSFIITLTDVFVAGRIGKEVQAAYGLVLQFYFILSIVITALNVGAVSVISRLFTANKHDEFIRSISSALVASILVGAIIGLTGVTGAPGVLGMLSMPDEVKAYAVPLLRIYAIGLFFHSILITTNSILRATHRIRKSLNTMGVVCVLNVALNFILVFKTSLGFRGIGVATAASMCIGMLINIYYVRADMRSMRAWSWAVVKKLFSIGWPIGLLQLMWMLGQAIIYLILGMLPHHSVEAMAAFTNGLRVESAIYLPAFAFNFANAVVVGNMLGAKRYRDAYRNGWITAGIGVCVICVLTVIVVLNAQWLMPVLSDNALVVHESRWYLYIAALAEPFAAITFILAGGLEGAGDTKSVMLRVAASIWLLRLPLVYLFAIVLDLGISSVWWALVISTFVQSLLIVQRYRSRKWLPVVSPQG